MPDIKDIYWLAGLLEGEGCFGFYKSRNSWSPQIQLAMTDSDIVYRAKKILGGDTEVYPSKRQENYKIAYMYRVTGNLAIQWMMTLYSLMGDRRKEKFKEVIIKWKEFEGFGRGGDHRYRPKNIGGTIDAQYKEILRLKGITIQ